MKNMGWQFFFALLLADVIGVIMLSLNVHLKTVLIVGAIIFVVLAMVLFFSNNSHERLKKREQQAVAKIADLQDQVEEALNSKKNPPESSVH